VGPQLPSLQLSVAGPAEHVPRRAGLLFAEAVTDGGERQHLAVQSRVEHPERADLGALLRLRSAV
jgi:hypothetical protein